MKRCKIKKKAAEAGCERFREKQGKDGSLLLLCRECQGEEAAKDLRSWLERKLEKHPESQVRVRLADCLGPCPDDEIATVVGGQAREQWRSGWTVEPRKERSKLLAKLLERD